MDKPNILYIMTDQQSFRMLGCAGNPYVSTPNLDKLAAKGIRFDNAYCANPVCIPSRFSLFTGRMPSEIGLHDNWVKDHHMPSDAIKATGMGHLVKAAGYDVFYGGKEHFPHIRATELGFDYFCRDEREVLAAESAALLKKKHDRPFLLVTSLINPHDICYQAIKAFAGNKADRGILERGAVEVATLEEAMKLPDGVDEDGFFATVCPPAPENLDIQQDEPGAITELQAQRNFKQRARAEWGEKEWRMHRWAYAQLTTLVDGQIGRVLDAVEEAGIADNTVIIFTSDHGDMDGSHRMEHKTAFYDEASRVPFIIYDPQAVPGSAGTVSDVLVNNGLDLVPTVCDYAGAAVPDDFKGISLKPVVRKGAVPGRKSVPVENEFGEMIVTAGYKYMKHWEGANAEQLMDRKNDPGEMRNALDDAELQPVLDEHRRLFGEWFGS